MTVPQQIPCPSHLCPQIGPLQSINVMDERSLNNTKLPLKARNLRAAAETMMELRGQTRFKMRLSPMKRGSWKNRKSKLCKANVFCNFIRICPLSYTSLSPFPTHPSCFSEFTLRSVLGCLPSIISMLLNGASNEGLLLPPQKPHS